MSDGEKMLGIISVVGAFNRIFLKVARKRSNVVGGNVNPVLLFAENEVRQ